MSTTGTVRAWNPEHGLGVIDSSDTPGGCWVIWSRVGMHGSRDLVVGDEVEFLWERADQDGFAFRATSVWPPGEHPVYPEGQNIAGTSAFWTRVYIDGVEVDRWPPDDIRD